MLVGDVSMKFTLHYDGPLPSSGNRPKNAEKWEIRSKLHPQLADLWISHPALRAVEDNRHFPKRGGATLTQAHHLYPGPVQRPITGPLPLGYQTRGSQKASAPLEILDLCESIEKGGAWFRPLVRDSYALHCGLTIRFLRREPPGKVYQGGDIDGRIKTLVDALTMPRYVEQVVDKTSSASAPVFCLLEDDSLVSGFQVESERLLGDTDSAADWVKLLIEVDVRVRQATIYNQSFLG